MSNHQSSQFAKVYKLKLFRAAGRSTLTLLPKVFYSLIQNLKMKYSLNSGRIKTHNNLRVFFTWQVDNKLLKAMLYVKTTAEFTGT